MLNWKVNQPLSHKTMDKDVYYFKLIGDSEVTNLELKRIDMLVDIPKDCGYVEEGWYTQDQVNRIEKELGKRNKLQFFPKVLEERFTDKGREYRLTSNVFKGSIVVPYHLKNADLNTIILEHLKVKAYSTLRQTDWTQISDEPFSTAERKEWRDYRQYLRNIDCIWLNKQIQEPRVMTFEEWKKHKPAFKPAETPWYLKGK